MKIKITFIRAVLLFAIVFGLLILLEEKALAATEDMEILYRITEAEATDEGYIGKRYVAMTVLNRMQSPHFPNTVEEVVFQKINGVYQFSPIFDHRYWSVKVTEETKIAVHSVVYSQRQYPDVLFFQATYVDGWINRNREFVFNHKGHNFYK